MKKILGISLIAVLAVSPMMANAAAGDPATYAIPAAQAGQQATNSTDVPEAGASAYFKGKAVTQDDAARVATGAYVKGAYNAAISAINKVAKDTKTAVDGKQDTLTEGDGIDIYSQTDSQTGAVTNYIKVKTTANKGLTFDDTNKTLEINKGDGIGFNTTTGALEVDLTDNKGLTFDATDKTLEINNGDGLTFDTTSGALKVNLQQDGGLSTDNNGKLYVTNAGNYATKTGVVNTIESSVYKEVDGVSYVAYTDWASDAYDTLSATVSDKYANVQVLATSDGEGGYTSGAGKYTETKHTVADGNALNHSTVPYNELDVQDVGQ